MQHARILYINICVKCISVLYKIADFGMARDVSEDYYITSGSQIPIRWTAPEVSNITMYPLHISTHKRYRHCTFASIQSKVMFGVTDVYCMRYGVLDIDHLKI